MGKIATFLALWGVPPIPPREAIEKYLIGGLKPGSARKNLIHSGKYLEIGHTAGGSNYATRHLGTGHDGAKMLM